MSYQRADANDQEPELLTLMEAATILRIGRTTAYELAHQYLATGGACGLPVVHVGKQLRVHRARLDEVIEHGTARRGESAQSARPRRPATSGDSPSDSADGRRLFP